MEILRTLYDGIDPLPEFFVNIGSDVKALVEGTDRSNEQRNLRVLSVALRVLGGFAAVVAASCLLSAVSGIIFAPVTAITSLVGCVFFHVIGHDLLVTGCNLSQKLRNGDISVQQFAGNLSGSLNKTWILGSLFR